jgi:transposase-like protein
MNSYDSWSGSGNRSTQARVVTLPTICPACRSSSITTTSRNPDENSYWRCGGCGEVWNASRRSDVQRGGYRWR